MPPGRCARARPTGRCRPGRGRRRGSPRRGSTQSPAGGRSRCTLRSVLMKMKPLQSSGALTPLPPSAATSTRCSGVGSSPSTRATRRRIQTVAGPGLEERPAREDDTPSRCASRRARRWRRTRRCSAASGPGGGSLLLPVGVDVRRGEAPAARPHHLALRPRQRRPRAARRCARARTTRALTASGCERHRREDLEGHAAHAHALARLAALERARRAAPTAGRRAGRSGPRDRGSARWASAAIAVQRVERVGHGAARL